MVSRTPLALAATKSGMVTGRSSLTAAALFPDGRLTGADIRILPYLNCGSRIADCGLSGQSAIRNVHGRRVGKGTSSLPARASLPTAPSIIARGDQQRP